MAVTETSYAVADIAALKALTGLPNSGSGLYYARYVDKLGWYRFDPDASTGGIAPNTGTGRWFPIEREILTADRTYYVRTDGNDSNTGLANTSGDAFLTWAKAQEVLATLDGNGYIATVKFTGTFTSAITIDKAFIGLSAIQLDGDTTTPSNAFINITGSDCITLRSNSTPIFIKGFRLATNTGICLANFLGTLTINGNMDFATAGFSHIYVSGQKSQVNQKASYTISGGSGSHIQIYDQSLFDGNDAPNTYTVTLTGTPNFSAAFIIAGRAATALFVNTTYSGSATGQRYQVQPLSGIWAIGTTFPGNSAGTADAKGYYGT